MSKLLHLDLVLEDSDFKRLKYRTKSPSKLITGMLKNWLKISAFKPKKEVEDDD